MDDTGIKKYITAGIILIFCILTGVILWLVFRPGYEMPVVPFTYHGEHGFICIFASSGDIYRIEPKDYGSHPYAFQTAAMTALENGERRFGSSITARYRRVNLRSNTMLSER
ncbi:MAG: hypothetical protein IJ819_10420 [Clostridiales bacterium]|nr:hypothetical protein [Clostridiales bacterium]